MTQRPALATSAGNPIGNNRNSITAGRRGALPLQDYQLSEKLAHQQNMPRGMQAAE